MSEKHVKGDQRAESANVLGHASDRRRAPRVRVLLRVEYESREDLAADYVTDLADGGLFIRTDLDLAIGTRIGVSLSFPGLLEPTLVDCVVRWRRPVDKGTPVEPAGVGVEFVGSLPGHRERVLGLLGRLSMPPRQEAPTVGTFRVLLVEDNAFVSELFRHAVLKLHTELVGYSSHDLMIARTGHEALRLLEDRKPDMVILDHYLPGITGCSLVRRIRSMPDHQRTPVLMISMGGDEVRREALASGATLYMDKPILLTQLLDTLRALTKETPCD